MPRSKRLRRIAAAACSVVSLIPAVARSDSSWIGPAGGSWSVAGNWSPSGVPTKSEFTSENVYVDGSTTVIFDYSYLIAFNGLTSLQIGDSGSGTPTINQTMLIQNNQMSADTVEIGENKNGQYLLGNGILEPQNLWIGVNANSAGTLNVSTTGLVNAVNTAVIGYSGAGTVTQSGTSMFYGNSGILLANGSLSSGYYGLSGGTLTVFSGSLTVAGSGAATFNQSGGTASMGVLEIASASGSNGTYLMGGGTLSSGSFQIGLVGNGTFNQTGGTVSIGSDLQISAGGSGTYLLGNGTLNAGWVDLNGMGELIQSGGTLSSSTLLLGGGNSSTGTYVQNGGVATFSGAATLSVYQGGRGEIDISGGALHVNSSLYVGENNYATVTLSNGTLAVGNSLYVGDQGGIGIFHQTGGTCTARLLNVGQTIDSFGVYVLDNGTITTSGIITVGESGNGTFIQNGGVVNSAGLLVNGALDEYGSFSGFYSMTGGIGSFTGDIQVGRGWLSIANATLSTANDVVFDSAYYGFGFGTVSADGALIVTGDLRCAVNGYGALVVTGGGLVQSDNGYLGLSTGAFGQVEVISSGATSRWNIADTLEIGSAYGGGSLYLEPGGAVKVGNLVDQYPNGSIAFDGGQLDITSGVAIIHYPSQPAAYLSNTQNAIRSGYNHGAWTGAGLTSSTAAAVATSTDPHKTALGYLLSTVLFPGTGLGTFDGIALAYPAVLVKYTYYGDSNLDGRVDVADLLNLAKHWNTTDGLWSDGDFNYDGVVNIADLRLLASNWDAGAGSAGTASLAPLLTSLGLPSLPAEEPEPSGLAAVAIALWPMLRRRRSRPSENGKMT